MNVAERYQNVCSLRKLATFLFPKEQTEFCFHILARQNQENVAKWSQTCPRSQNQNIATLCRKNMQLRPRKGVSNKQLILWYTLLNKRWSQWFKNLQNYIPLLLLENNFQIWVYRNLTFNKLRWQDILFTLFLRNWTKTIM